MRRNGRLVAIAAVVLTPLLWPVGLVFLWLSPVWDTRAKLIGSLALPGGLAPAVLLETGDRSSCPLSTTDTGASIDTEHCSIGPTYAWLHPGAPGFNHLFGTLVFTASLVLPIAVAVYLAIRLRMPHQLLQRAGDDRP